LSHRSTATLACGGFAAEHPAGGTYRSIAAGAGTQQQRRRSTALSSKLRSAAAHAGSVVSTADVGS